MSYVAAYPTYADAYRASTNQAYENDELVRVVFEKTVRHVEAMNSTMLELSASDGFSLTAIMAAARKDRPTRIIDVGGACGIHYFAARRVLPRAFDLQWTVVETPAMSSYAQRLANNELSFVSRIEQAVERQVAPDLVLTSGTIQCVDNPFALLNQIVGVGAPHIYFGRSAFIDRPTALIVTHKSMLSWNGVGPLPPGYMDREIVYPYTFLPVQQFLGTVLPRYEIVGQFNDPSGAFPVNGEPILGMGLLCRLKAPQ